jgi:enoyl-CoA hydratase/carnithine racemase
LEDFGTATDLALAHLIRTQQSAAARIYELDDRIRVELHGAVIGAGLEMAAAAGTIAAAPSTWFQLPELSMGLIPGAGGMASLPKRIGRHRTAFMLLSGIRIGVAKTVEWGLVDEVTK